MTKKNHTLIGLCTAALLAAACAQPQRNTQKDEIDEITHLVENWSYHNSPMLAAENATAYYTESLVSDYERADSIALAQDDEMGVLDFDPWTESQDPSPKAKGFVNEVYDITDSTAIVELTIINWDYQVNKKLYLRYTSEGWRIDDMTIDAEGNTLRSLF